MRFRLKFFVFVLGLVNIYFFSFFVWYQPERLCIQFESKYHTPGEGPYAATFVMPRFSDNPHKPAMAVRAISGLYKPLAWYWEKRGVFYFLPDEYSFSHPETVDKFELYNPGETE